jgi:hypothetical protein
MDMSRSTELLREIYEAFAEPETLLEGAPADVVDVELTPEPEPTTAFAFEYKGKVYHAGHVSRSARRNFIMLGGAAQAYAMAPDDESRAAIAAFMRALVATL